MARSYWSIFYYMTGSGIGTGWLSDNKIPRAGLEPMTETDTATIQFLDLVSGEKAKLSSETKSNLGEIILVFPKKVVTSAFKAQLQKYVDNEYAIRIPIPIATGANSYTERNIEGYITKLETIWEPTSRKQQEFTLKATIEEFDVE